MIFFAEGLEECEGLLVVDLLRRAGVEVTIAALGQDKMVHSSHGIRVEADALAGGLDYALMTCYYRRKGAAPAGERIDFTVTDLRDAAKLIP